MNNMSLDEFRTGLRDGSVLFCLPAAHENFTNDFLEQFSMRILKQGWHDVAQRTHLRIPAIVDDLDAEEDVAAAIRVEYGVDITNLAGLPLWEVMRRCAGNRPRRN